MPAPPMILGVNLSSIVAQALGDKFLPAVLTKITNGTYNSGNPGAGLSKTTTTYACRAIVKSYELAQSMETQTQNASGVIMLLNGSIAGGVIPTIGDTITMTWPDGVSRAAIVGKIVNIDPAGATTTVKVAA